MTDSRQTSPPSAPPSSIERAGITAIRAAVSRPRVLCVDDDQQVLDGLAHTLRRRYEVHTSLSGFAALERLAKDGVFAAVISDMRMPGMNGAVFLAHVRQRFPDSTRLLLTGHADLESATIAVNEGHIFRFLAKPCPPEKMEAAVEAAVEQYRLVTAERVLLEQTLRGSIKALTDILALQNPLAFGRANRAKAHITALAAALGIAERWPLEVAAMLFPIGTITLPAETVEKLYHARPLTSAEAIMVKRLPAVTEQLLANIPRLEPVREILADVHFESEEAHGGGIPGHGSRRAAKVPPGARLLQMVLDYDLLESQAMTIDAALDTMRSRHNAYDPEQLEAFALLLGNQEKHLVEELRLGFLQPGMVLVQDVRSTSGMLLVARGHEVTASLIERMRNVSRNSGVNEPVRVMVPPALRDKPE